MTEVTARTIAAVNSRSREPRSPTGHHDRLLMNTTEAMPRAHPTIELKDSNATPGSSRMLSHSNTMLPAWLAVKTP